MARFFKHLLYRTTAAAVFVLITLQLWFFAQVWYYVHHNPSTTVFMQNRLDRLRARSPGAALHQQWVPYERISPNLKRAVVTAEDAKFVDHGGFDWTAIQEAAEENIHRGHIVAGGSTITQQLAKNLFSSGKRIWWRKAEEAAVTVMIESLMSKRRILEIYLNVIEWGNGVFGAEAAAEYRFGVSAAQLSVAQAAELAAMVPSPRRYHLGAFPTPYLQRRAALIAARMVQTEIP